MSNTLFMANIIDEIGHFVQNIIGKHNEILIMSLLIILGLVFSTLAKKIKLPKITGYILAGIVIGDPLLHVITHENFESLQSINLIALGLMSITIGAHLNFHKLKNTGKRVIFVLLGESVFSFVLVFTSIYFFTDIPFGPQMVLFFSLLVAAISIATAPAATVAMVKETKAKGLVVNTLMPVVAMNNVLCIIAFGIIANMIGIKQTETVSTFGLIILLTKDVLISAVIGIIAGFLLKIFAEKSISSNGQVLTLVILTVLVTTGVSKIFNINSMLPCMVIGIVITNTSQFRAKILSIFEEIEYVILIVFFALAGAHIDLGSIAKAGVIAIVYFFARGVGKVVGGSFGAFIAKAPKRVYKYMGSTLLPQAGVAIGLVILAGGIAELKPILNLLTTLILAVVALNEIAGPPITKWALSKSGDAGHDRPKLIEFIQEDYIKVNLKSTTKEEVIHEMVDFFIKSHKGSKKFKKEILKSVFSREKQGSTGIGSGVAMPHGVVSKGPIIWGALGLSSKGIDFDSIDGKPTYLIVLIVTPENHKADMHLAVLSEISKILADKTVLEQLFQSKTAAEICEVIFQKEHMDFNYFLDD